MADPPLGSELRGQQLALYEAISERNGDFASWYRGARIAVENTGNPEGLVHAAHSIRELMNNLHRIGDLPVQADAGRLNDKFEAMRSTWDRAKRRSDCYSDDGGWRGEIDDHARRAFAAVDEAIRWQAENRVRWQEQHLATIRQLDVAHDELPSWIENAFVVQWASLRDYFVGVSHRRGTDRAEFLAALDVFEKFVLERLRPRTFEDQRVLDEAIAEAEGA